MVAIGCFWNFFGRGKGEQMALVSFAADIKPLFRPVDVKHMNVHGIKLDDYQYMSDPANNYSNAESVLETVSPQGAHPPTMPPGGPYWTPEQVALFAKWRSDGYQP
jgi:hypothetical protein